jgi:hypothetical protein
MTFSDAAKFFLAPLLEWLSSWRLLLVQVSASSATRVSYSPLEAAGYVNTGSVLSFRASIAFIYIFGVFFVFSWTSMQPLYPIEVMSTKMRAKGVFIFQVNPTQPVFLLT